MKNRGQIKPKILDLMLKVTELTKRFELNASTLKAVEEHISVMSTG